MTSHDRPPITPPIMPRGNGAPVCFHGWPKCPYCAFPSKARRWYRPQRCPACTGRLTRLGCVRCRRHQWQALQLFPTI